MKTALLMIAGMMLAAPADAAVPRLVLDGRECAMLSKAYELMRSGIQTKPVDGFTEPFFPPGANYGNTWWQLDSSTVLEAWKWCDFGFCRRSIQNFRKVQRPDGRIPLWGPDKLPPARHISRQKENVSSLPTIFKTAHSLATMGGDRTLAREMFEMSARYLGWWRSNRVDRATGLVASVFEETFPPWLGSTGEYAGVDTGVMVALGAEWTAEIADGIGRGDEAAELRAFSRNTFAAMRERMWDARDGLFRPYDLRTGTQGFESAEGFYMFADRGLGAGRREALLKSLTGPRFAWGTMPLASMAVDSPHYTNTIGRAYKANPSWCGNVWSLINRWTVHALLRSGCEKEAVSLALATKRMIDRAGTFDEFYLTTDGSSQGGLNYLWTAADYAILVIEDLLGVSYDGATGKLSVRPRIKSDFRLENLSLPDGSYATVVCEKGVVTQTRAWPRGPCRWRPTAAGQIQASPGEKAVGLFRSRLLSERARGEIFDETVNAFRTHYDDVHPPANGKLNGYWQGEYWGKAMLSHCAYARLTGDADERAFAQRRALELVEGFQRGDGYLATYSDADFVTGYCWNIWGRKYTMWGLVEAYDLTGDASILEAARKMAVHLDGQLGRLGLSLGETGFFSGIPSMSILKPLLLVYMRTGEPAALSLARAVVAENDRSDGRCPNLIANAFSDAPVHAWYPKPNKWAKAYELMSVLEGFVLYSRVTGERRPLDAAVRIFDKLAHDEENGVCAVGFHDHFIGARAYPNAISESCDVIHWMRLCRFMYEETGREDCLDSWERAYLNAFLAGVYRSGVWATHDVRGHGRRHLQGMFEVKMFHHFCCLANDPRGFCDYLESAFTSRADGSLDVNFYTDGEYEAAGVSAVVSGNYPVGDEVTVRLKAPRDVRLRFRVPAGCSGLRIVRGRDTLADSGEGGRGRLVVDVAAGETLLTLSFALPVRIEEWRTDRVPDPELSEYATRNFEMAGYNPEMAGLARKGPGVRVFKGPLLLAKGTRAGATEAATFGDMGVDGTWKATLVPRPAKGGCTWGAWDAVFEKGGQKKTVPVSDYQSASDGDGWHDSFSIWF